MEQNRFRSPMVWLSVVALLALILNNYGLWESFGLNEAFLNDVANAVIGILVMLGILNNPTDREDW